VNTSVTSSSTMTPEPDGVSRRRAARNASAGRGISWSPPKIATRSKRPEMPGPEASVTANVTRLDSWPVRTYRSAVPVRPASSSEAYQVGELP